MMVSHVVLKEENVQTMITIRFGIWHDETVLWQNTCLLQRVCFPWFPDWSFPAPPPFWWYPEARSISIWPIPSGLQLEKALFEYRSTLCTPLLIPIVLYPPTFNQ